MYKPDLEKAEEPEIKLPYMLDHGKSKGILKICTSVSLTMLKPLTVWATANCGIFLIRLEYQHITCLTRNMYAGQEATVRIGHGTTDWLKIGKGVHQGCILSLCLFNLYEEYIM